MRLIDSRVEILPQESGVEGIYKQIEKAARVCYKSEDFIKEGSAEKMVNALINRGHGSPLEHGTVYLNYTVPRKSDKQLLYVGLTYGSNPYSNTETIIDKDIAHIYITTNLRVLLENDSMDDLQYLCNPTEHHEKRVSVRIICSRGVSHEAVRHRTMSFCQTSQRYVNYTLDKFGNEITFIIPEWIYDIQSEEASYNNRDYLMELNGEELIDELAKINESVCMWKNQLKNAENCYMYLINDTKGSKLKPQEARGVLPNDCMTELIITGDMTAWKHFFDLRCARAAHPDIRKIAWKIVDKFVELGYITEEERLNYVK